MRSSYILAAAAATALSASTTMAAGLLYAPVVTQVGDGTNALSSVGATTTIQVYSPSIPGQLAPVAQMAYPSAAGIGGTLVNVGNSSTEGQLQNNPGLADAAAAGLPYSGTAYVFSGGYSGADQQAGVNNTTVANSRVIGYMSVTANAVSAGTIGATETNADSYTGGNIRGVVGNDTATNFWASGTGGSAAVAGYRYFSSPSSTQLVASPGPVNVRSIQIRQGQLYGSSDTGNFVGISQIGTGTPTTSGQTATALFSAGAGAPPSSGTSGPMAFALLDDPSVATPTGVPFNVAYVDDVGSANPGIEKWVYDPANSTNGNNGWTNVYTFGDKLVTGAPVGYWGLAAQEETVQLPAGGSATAVVLYATDNAPLTASGQNSLEQFTDILNGGTQTLANASEIILATAPANDAFRGVALAPLPVPEPASLSLLGLGAIGLIARRRK